ncbi:hypothetical protein SAMN04488500_103143 [Sporomusa malonica]|uniref:Uncharacterized protein n=1 Tax=Sporomusa malonica TaxID=112901 RepID=A0A1W1ZAN8_9FIRM|nr:hypothetical protein SAMN04488500_103143 [Sporomusa malonica]
MIGETVELENQEQHFLSWWEIDYPFQSAAVGGVLTQSYIINVNIFI